jgi:hypothetical protein
MSSPRLVLPAIATALALVLSTMPGGSPTALAGRGQVAPAGDPSVADQSWGTLDEPPVLELEPAKDPSADWRVVAIAEADRTHGAPAALERARGLGLEVVRGRVRLVIEASDVAAAKRGAKGVGAEVEAAAAGLVQVMAAPGQLARLARSTGVVYVRPPMAHVLDAVTGQGIGATSSGSWHAAGQTGSGVKVAIIDGGFAGLATAQASGDLPASLTTADYCSGQFGSATEHGTAVAEIVHEIAPSAQLYLVCVGTEVQLAQAVAYAKANGITVINHSVSWFNTSRGDGSGGAGTPDATAADARGAGILWVNAAGNRAQTHWSGAFVNNGSGWHLFAAGNIGNGFTIGAGATACAFLKWDDWPGSAQDYDLYIADAGANIVAASTNAQAGAQPPGEAVCYTNPGSAATFFVAIHRYSATLAPRFDLFVTGVGGIQYQVAAGSVTEPGSSPATFAAGAVCWAASTIEPFSSQGPTIDGRVKPDLSGQDQVSGTTYGPYAGCSSFGGFPGTSAAAPHVAGAAALVRGANPGYTVDQIEAFLESSSVDLGAGGADTVYGSGLLHLPNPVPAPTPPPLPTPPPGAVTLVSEPNPSLVDATVTLTATLASGTATGSVTFRDVTGGGSTDLGSAAIDGGSASITTAFAAPGLRQLVADYGGDGSNPPATSAPLEHRVRAAVLTPTTTSLALAPNPVATGAAATFTATVAPNPASGVVEWIIDGLVAGTTPVGPQGTATVSRTYWAPGTHTVQASFSEGAYFDASSSPQQVLTVRLGTGLALVSSRSTAVSGETLVTFTAATGEPDASGTVTFRDTLGSTTRVLGTRTLALNAGTGLPTATLSVRLAGAGVHAIDAAYGGNGTYAPASSAPVVVTVSPDVGVSASGVGRAYSTFYPYKDGYRDTNAIRGTPGEPLSVSVRIYNSSGRLVRSWSLATRTTAWSIAWTGKTSSGTRLPAGKYRIVQKLRDAVGHTKSYTSYTNISNKRLYWYTDSITKYADTGLFLERYYADVNRSTRYYRGVVLDGGWDCDPDDMEWCDIALGVHRFTLPAAKAYASIRFSILGQSASGSGAGYMAIEDYVNEEFDVTRSIGSSWAWRSTSSVGSSGHVNSSRVVSGWVWAWGYNEGRVEYQKVRVTFKYALLR